MTKLKTKRVTEKQKREAYRLVASLGGKATFKKIGRKGMSEIGKKGAKARWKK